MARSRIAAFAFVVLLIAAGVGLRAALQSDPVPAMSPTAAVTPIDAAPLAGTPAMSVAASATNGVIEIVIPPGAYARIQGGELDFYHLPSVMNLAVGDRIVIRNNDEYPHLIMYAFVPVDGVDERVFTTPGSEVYTAGCTASAADFAPFTTIFIKE
jgi:hypothetical protein